MMDHKPWDNRDSHREGFLGRREWNSDRSDRSDRSERRFGEDRPRQSRDDRFGGDRQRFSREDRNEGDRRFGSGDRQHFGGGRRFGEDRPRYSRDHYSSRTGPRARAYGESRYQERDEYSKRQIVKIDAEVATFFPTAKDVNDALRLVIALTRKVRERAPEGAAADEGKKAPECVEENAPEVEQMEPEDGVESVPGDEDIDETLPPEAEDYEDGSGQEPAADRQ